MTLRAVPAVIHAEEKGSTRGLQRGLAEFASRRTIWLLAVVDVLVLAGAVDLAVWIHLGLYRTEWPDLMPFHTYTGATIFTLLTSLLCFSIFELYSPKEIRRVSDVAARLLMALAVSLAVMSALSFWLPSWRLLRGIQVYFAVIAFVAMLVWRWVALHAIEHWLPPTRVVMVGVVSQLEMLEQVFNKYPWAKLEIVARLPVHGEFGLENSEPGIPFGGLLELAAASQAKVIVASLSGPPRDDVLQELLRCKGAGLQVTDGASMYKAVTGRVPILLADKMWMAFGPDFNLSGNMTTRILQRAMDIGLGLLGLLVAGPLMALTALLVYLVDGGPVLFRQERVGENGRRYQLIKFRTMRRDAEKDGPQWSTKGDDRVLPGGRLLRATRLDELPQLWNVLKGEMSFIGPRPERAFFVETLSKTIPFYSLRFCVKPGLSGWAQVNYGYGASEEDAAVKLEYDLFYIQEMSTYLNLLILLRTVSTVLFRRGT
jgi:exopolysaccharide biosynthesis polyprenyl glycosylphosphotransferase